jgi:Ca-activated chloride channel family protein
MIDRDDPRLTAYALGEADAETALVVEQALAESEALRRAAAEIRDTAALLSKALAAESAPALTADQHQAIAEGARASARRRLPRALPWAGLAAAAAVVALVVSRDAGPLPEVRTAAGPSPAPIAPGVATPSSGPPPTPAGRVTVQGVVRDATGAALPGANVVVEELATGRRHHLSTDGQGRYEKKDIPAGPIVATADLPGFQDQRSGEIQSPGAVVDWNPTLQVGAVTESVTVAGTAVRSANMSAAAAARPSGLAYVDVQRPSEREDFNTEAYAHREDSGFVETALHPLSTFSVDVDTASYSNVRRFLGAGRLPPVGAVRVEEMVNYFPYDYAAPQGRDAFAAHVEAAPAPWNPAHRLLRVGLKAREIAAEKRPATNLVFLIDVSGSMNQPNKLPLVQRALKMLVRRLDSRDRVAIVVYAGRAGLVLPSIRGDREADILEAIDRLEAGGSTNGGEGIQLAYDIASREFVRGGVNRVVLATDGDFNVGVTDEGSLVRLVQQKAKTGVFLTVLGFGMGNLQDARLESLADKGNGSYAYVDTENEARKALVEEMTSTLVTVAKDVKVQIEFNPARVRAYRLLGYENRRLEAEDFKDDAKDAGEVGAGHAVTALYELVPPGVPLPRPAADPLVYQRPAAPGGSGAGSDLMRLKVRYRQPDGQTGEEREWRIPDRVAHLEDASADFKFQAAVAAFGMILRDSPHKGGASLDAVLALADEGLGPDAGGYRAEFVGLVKRAQALRGRE